MDTLPALRELQATLSHLATINQALANFPPDLAALETRLRSLQSRMADASKALASAQDQIGIRSRELAQAQKEEDRARAAVKDTHQKVQYTSAIRELDEKERLKASILKPLKALEAQAEALKQTLARLEEERPGVQAQFDELHAIFLEEHANQVEGRKLLLAKQAELEARMGPSETTRFHRLAAARKGRAVVPVENGACSGCNVKLRSPVLFQLKEGKTLLSCESCQRILFLP